MRPIVADPGAVLRVERRISQAGRALGRHRRGKNLHEPVDRAFARSSYSMSEPERRAEQERTAMAEYLILITGDESAAAASDAESTNIIVKGHQEFGERDAAHAARGCPAAHPPTATSVRQDASGGFVVTDGAFAKTKEALGGIPRRSRRPRRGAHVRQADPDAVQQHQGTADTDLQLNRARRPKSPVGRVHGRRRAPPRVAALCSPRRWGGIQLRLALHGKVQCIFFDPLYGIKSKSNCSGLRPAAT